MIVVHKGFFIKVYTWHGTVKRESTKDGIRLLECALLRKCLDLLTQSHTPGLKNGAFGDMPLMGGGYSELDNTLKLLFDEFGVYPETTNIEHFKSIVEPLTGKPDSGKCTRLVYGYEWCYVDEDIELENL